MLKCEIDGNKHEFNLEVCGNVIDLSLEISFIINAVYTRLMKSDADASDAFKELIVEEITDNDSLMWNTSSGEEEGDDEE